MTHAIPQIPTRRYADIGLNLPLKFQVVLHFNDGSEMTYLNVKNPSKFIHLAEVRFGYTISGRTLESATVISQIIAA